jgi:phenylalanyl-tRNA synthetase beta chain
MRLPINWLSDFVEVTVSPEELAEKLTMAGFEVEALETLTPGFSGVVVSRVKKVEPHPQAARLKLTEVEDGRRTYRVVCGAPDVTAGRLYAFAPPGAVIARGRKIEAIPLRGVISEGMLLAEDELGISEDHTTLMDIPQDLPLGQDLAEALKLTDVILDVAVTPNRPDCLSILGLAREVSALLKQPLRHPEASFPEGPESVQEVVRVTILDPVRCPRYAARLVVDLTVKPSPFWMRRRLQSAGLRAINNLVDVTNYVLLEFGQPLHAFDFDRLAGGEIIVRLPRPEERRFFTLDSQERLLNHETLLICDAVKPVALAGIMGGLESEVTDHTRRVLIESAYFNPATIRRTSKRLGLSTESSYRFERGVDPDGVICALERATQLMVELGGGKALAGRIDEYPTPIPRPRLTLRVSRANRVLGTNLAPARVEEILRDLHIPAISFDGEHLVVQAPSHRGDLLREEDLIEEIARLAGYEEIPVALPEGLVDIPKPPPEVGLRHEARHLLQGLGFCETITYSFQGERLFHLLGPEERVLTPLHLANPLSEDQALMRTSLLPGLLEALRRNVLRQIPDVRLFEIARTFIPQPGADLPLEEQWLAGVMYGSREEPSWLTPSEPLDFFDLKGVVETLLKGLQIPEAEFKRETLPPYLLYGAKVFAGTRELGILGVLSPMVAEQLDLEGQVFVFQLNMEALCQAVVPPLYEPLPRYPAVYRDLAIILPISVPAARVTQALYTYGQPWLTAAQLFDVYTGDPIPEGNRSLAFHLTYRDPERTLTDEEVDRHHQKLVAALAKELGAQLR